MIGKLLLQVFDEIQPIVSHTQPIGSCASWSSLLEIGDPILGTARPIKSRGNSGMELQ